MQPQHAASCNGAAGRQPAQAARITAAPGIMLLDAARCAARSSTRPCEALTPPTRPRDRAAAACASCSERAPTAPSLSRVHARQRPAGMQLHAARGRGRAPGTSSTRCKQQAGRAAVATRVLSRDKPWPPNEDVPQQPGRSWPEGGKQDHQVLDWRSFRAKLVLMERAGLLTPGCSRAAPFEFASDAWAHELPALETGCLLVARQEGMGFFDRAVVLLAARDETHGSVGFVINRPSPLRVSEMQLADAATANAAPGMLQAFGDQRLHLGGPVQGETLTVLHRHAGLAGAHEVAGGLRYGGLPAAVALVQRGLARPQDFLLLLGMAGWAPGQLEAEVAAGAWLVAATPAAVVLGGAAASSASAPDALWRRLLGLLGSTRPMR